MQGRGKHKTPETTSSLSVTRQEMGAAFLPRGYIYPWKNCGRCIPHPWG